MSSSQRNGCMHEKGRIICEPSNKFFAFNVGPTICPGKEMAFKIVKSVAAAILFNYHVQVLDCPVIPAERIIDNMKHGLLANVKNRFV